MIDDDLSVEKEPFSAPMCKDLGGNFFQKLSTCLSAFFQFMVWTDAKQLLPKEKKVFWWSFVVESASTETKQITA